MCDLPGLSIVDIRRFFADGDHNAFTDLVRFQDRIYLTFRSCPDGHMVFPTSKVRIFVSSDEGENWRQVHEFSVPARDTRDPHFLVFGDRLFVYSGTWLCPEKMEDRDINDHLGYGVWSADGESWSDPISLEGTYGHYIWRAATYAGRAYLCGRRRKDFVAGVGGAEGGAVTEAALLASDDGLVWHFHSLIREHYGDETALLFEPDGELLALARTLAGGGNAYFCRTQPPYTSWQRQELDRYVGGPMLVRWDGHLLVAGRKQSPGQPPVTTLYWLKDGVLRQACELPSGGDNSYTGFVALAGNEALVSYYSTHESTPGTNIYLARIRMETP
jgi:hypothetical protein